MTQLDLTMDIRMRELDIQSAELRAYIAANTDLPSRYAHEGDFADYCFSEIHERAEIYRTYDCIGAYDEPFQVTIREYQGVFFVQAPEFDDRGFFLDVDMAVHAAEDIASNFSGPQ
jgi:hypothetical protein